MEIAEKIIIDLQAQAKKRAIMKIADRRVLIYYAIVIALIITEIVLTIAGNGGNIFFKILFCLLSASLFFPPIFSEIFKPENVAEEKIHAVYVDLLDKKRIELNEEIKRVGELIKTHQNCLDNYEQEISQLKEELSIITLWTATK